ncbi:hypothetical protein KKG66_07355, partial [bacterium]|nr:hypothetical protein [bacterium]
MKNKKTFLMLAAFVLLGLLLSCSKKENQSGQTGDAESGFELNFEVNSALLGERIDVADLEFAAPRGWSSVPEKIMEMMRKHAAKDTGKLGMIPE